MQRKVDELDQADLAILRALQADGRISNVNLASKVGLSEAACLRRVRALEKAGYILGYVGLLNPAKLGFSGNVFVEVTLKHDQQRDLDAFERAVRAVPEVMECHLMTGDFDYLLRVVVRDLNDYERIHRQSITRLPGVSRLH
jgi:Lrp/AsnC family transcriptional regulator, leucine-responsive regulatory protein